MRERTNLLAALIAIGGIGLSPAAAAAGWKYQVNSNDGYILTYSDEDKVTFYLGCGRGLRCTPDIPARQRRKARRASR